MSDRAIFRLKSDHTKTFKIWGGKLTTEDEILDLIDFCGEDNIVIDCPLHRIQDRLLWVRMELPQTIMLGGVSQTIYESIHRNDDYVYILKTDDGLQYLCSRDFDLYILPMWELHERIGETNV